jgi:NAD(P)-dependent dehydrogenase (short-subunit alcohol dehydrogenase family)
MEESMPNQRLLGRVALVTGAEQGIGRALAIGLAREGATVGVNYPGSPDQAQQVCASIRAEGGRAEALQADVRRAAEVQAMLKRLESSFGRVDILINNAGIFPRATVAELDEATWDDVLGVNLKGCFLCCQAVLPLMQARRSGRIVNIASTAAFRPTPRGAHYAASKAGIVAFTKALALEVAAFGITANCLAPGTTDTAQPRYGMTEDELQAQGPRIPLGRIAQPEDMVEPVLFLVSDAGAYVTGQTIHVNGGSLMV